MLGSHGIWKRKDIYPLYTEELDNAILLWKDYKRFGLPHGIPAKENDDYLSMIRAFEDEYEEEVAEIRQKALSKK